MLSTELYISERLNYDVYPRLIFRYDGDDKIIWRIFMKRFFLMQACILFSILCLYSGDGSAEEKNTARPCGPAMKADSLKGLIGEIGGLKWDYSGPYSARNSGVSADIDVPGSLSLSAKDIPVPASCLKRDDCRHASVMVIPKGFKGITCTQTENLLGVDYCVAAKLSKTTFRLRGKMIDTHPWKWNFIPVLEFLAPCSEPCKPGEFRCAADNTCRTGFNGYCRNCLELPAKNCACLNEKGPLPEGTRCTWFISGDVICAGACRNGECVIPETSSGDCGLCCR